MLIPPDELERKATELKTRLSYWEWGYIVGLIEGEGSLLIHYIKKTAKYYPEVCITNTNLKILMYFQSKLKIGKIYQYKRGEGRRECYLYWIRGRESIILLSIITKLLFSDNKSKAALMLALNKCNCGPYAEKIKSRVNYLTNKEEEENIINIKYSNEFTMKNNVTEFELGLLAGLIDGEGNISIHKNLSQLTVMITSTSPKIIYKVLAISQGWRLYKRKLRPPRRTYYNLRLFNINAKPLLEKIKDYLIIKKDRAEIALDFLETLGRPGAHPIPTEIKKTREELYWKLRKLNMRGTVYSGGPVALTSSHPRLGIEWNFPRVLVLIDV